MVELTTLAAAVYVAFYATARFGEWLYERVIIKFIGD